ncbi:hypothetical protein DIPPA_25864 [Diplonema papillatum]|nr:hypothetical protein DIPPA_25864 [Diplonema papillatum]
MPVPMACTSDEEAHALAKKDLAVVASAAKVRQLGTDDCGLACCAGVLNWLFSAARPQDRLSVAGTVSLFEACMGRAADGGAWTVELFFFLNAALLRHRLAGHATVRFTTVSLCVPEDHRQNSFYANGFDEELTRVTPLFQALQTDRRAQVLRLSDADLAARLSKRRGACVFVVLVDAAVLYCRCRPLACGCTQKVKKPGSLGSPFAGHYVVLTGVCRERSLFFYTDPASVCPTCCATFTNFNSARCEKGTDQDVIEIVAKAASQPETLSE